MCSFRVSSSQMDSLLEEDHREVCAGSMNLWLVTKVFIVRSQRTMAKVDDARQLLSLSDFIWHLGSAFKGFTWNCPLKHILSCVGGITAFVQSEAHWLPWEVDLSNESGYQHWSFLHTSCWHDDLDMVHAKKLDHLFMYIICNMYVWQYPKSFSPAVQHSDNLVATS